MATNNYGWLLFPNNKIIESATIYGSGSDYKYVLLLPDNQGGNNRYIARGFLNAASTGTFEGFTASTTYSVTYAYLDA